MEQVTASFPLGTVQKPRTPTTDPSTPQIRTNSWRITAKKIEFAVWGGNQPERKVDLCCMATAFRIKSEFITSKLRDAERAQPSPSSTLLIPRVLPLGKGRHQQPPAQHSSASESARAAWFGTFLLPPEFWRSPTAPAGGEEKERWAANTRVRPAQGGEEPNKMNLFVWEEEWKHGGCYFRLPMAWNIDTQQSTKNILLNFKLPGTWLGQQSYAL